MDNIRKIRLCQQAMHDAEREMYDAWNAKEQAERYYLKCKDAYMRSTNEYVELIKSSGKTEDQS